MTFTYVKVRHKTSGTDGFLAIPCGNFCMNDVDSLRYFTYKKVLYIWCHHLTRFLPVESLDCEVRENHQTL